MGGGARREAEPMNVPELCPALLHDSEERRVICFREKSVPGAWVFVCLRATEEAGAA